MQAGIRSLVVPLAPRLRSLKLTSQLDPGEGHANSCPAELLQMGNLTRLDLVGLRLDDALVSHLSRLTNLRQLGISLTGGQAGMFPGSFMWLLWFPCPHFSLFLGVQCIVMGAVDFSLLPAG